MKPFCVVCVGNELLGDDGVGPRVGRVLEKVGLPGSVQVVFVPSWGLDLVDVFFSSQGVVAVDAVQMGQRPGAVHLLRPEELPSRSGSVNWGHSLDLKETIEIARNVFGEGPLPPTSIVGVEVASLHQYSAALSPPVLRALPLAVTRVLRLVNASPQLVQKASALALEEPAVLDEF